jgi:hypothetical protein
MKVPEDYQAILTDLGINDPAPATDPAPADPAPATDPTPASNDGGAPAAQGNDDGQPAAQPAQPQADPQGDDEEAQRRNEAFAAMRAENSKYKKLLQNIMKGANFNGSEDDFIDQLTEASYAQQAKRQGNQVSPEILKRMDTLESQNKSLIDSQNRQTFAANLKNLQETFTLSDADIKEFLTLAAKEQIDLTAPGTNFRTLYQGLFFDKLKDKMIETERQAWIAQSNKANSAANPDGKSGKKDPAPTNVNTMAEFDSLLQSVPMNKK